MSLLVIFLKQATFNKSTSMFYLAGIIITFFLSVLLAGKRGKSVADKILATWLLVTGLHLTIFYLYLSRNYIKFPWFLGVEVPLPLLYGPFLYLYTTALTQIRKVKAISLLHFLPVIIVYILTAPFFRLSTIQKISVYQNKGVGYEWLTDNVFIAIVASGVIYIILSFLKLRQHKVNIENQFSNTARINLNWLRYLIYGTSVIWIVVITASDDIYIFATVVIFVFFIGYFGIRQVGIFSNFSPTNKNTEAIKEIKKPVDNESQKEKSSELAKFSLRTKYQKSSLSKDDADRIHDQLQLLMVKEKLFKEAELDLGELAEKLSIHPNTLSQVINSYENKTFYDYINRLRIEEFKTLAANPGNRQYTLLSLAFECGFNSKTAFNRNFKKTTGLSPSEYLSEVKVNLA